MTPFEKGFKLGHQVSLQDPSSWNGRAFASDLLRIARESGPVSPGFLRLFSRLCQNISACLSDLPACLPGMGQQASLRLAHSARLLSEMAVYYADEAFEQEEKEQRKKKQRKN